MSCHASDPDRLLVKPYTNAPRRGEIVVFNAPKAAAEAACNASGAFVKRLIGLPGETVEEKVGLISIDGKPLDEPYIRPNRRDHQSGTWSVQQGRYFFVGDNRRESCDSRRYGAVPRKNIIGQVVTIFRLR